MEEEPTAILQYLYIGSKAGLEKIDDFHFIVNCTVNVPFPKYPMEKILRIPVEDDETDNLKLLEMMFYTNVLEKIYKCICNKQKVLVFSEKGQQRSCSLVACFLIRYMRMKPTYAVDFIGKERKSAFGEENRFINTIDFYYHYVYIEKENIPSFYKKIEQKQNKKIGPRIQPI